jgi:hypothetical protein
MRRLWKLTTVTTGSEPLTRAFADCKRQPPEALRRDLAVRGWSGASSDPVVGPGTSHH